MDEKQFPTFEQLHPALGPDMMSWMHDMVSPDKPPVGGRSVGAKPKKVRNEHRSASLRRHSPLLHSLRRKMLQKHRAIYSRKARPSLHHGQASRIVTVKEAAALRRFLIDHFPLMLPEHNHGVARLSEATATLLLDRMPFRLCLSVFWGDTAGTYAN